MKQEINLLELSPFTLMVRASQKRWQNYLDGKISRHETDTLDMLYWLDLYK